jgi:hypothetical protein
VFRLCRPSVAAVSQLLREARTATNHARDRQILQKQKVVCSHLDFPSKGVHKVVAFLNHTAISNRLAARNKFKSPGMCGGLSVIWARYQEHNHTKVAKRDFIHELNSLEKAPDFRKRMFNLINWAQKNQSKFLDFLTSFDYTKIDKAAERAIELADNGKDSGSSIAMTLRIYSEEIKDTIRHAIVVAVRPDSTITVFDSNLGELNFRAPAKAKEFLTELCLWYHERFSDSPKEDSRAALEYIGDCREEQFQLPKKPRMLCK